MNLVVQQFMLFVAILFGIYMFLYTTFLFITVLIGALRLHERDRMNALKNEIKHEYYIPVSIIVPAFNEEIIIVDCIKSLLNQNYKLYEIIVVDDGSTDGTTEKLLNTFSFHQTNRPIQYKLTCHKADAIYETIIDRVKITLIRKENGGKADALNMGINVSGYPYFVTIDADSFLQKNSIEKIIQPVLEDEKVVAVGGMVRVAQSVRMKNGEVSDYRLPWHPIVGMQVIEYDRSFLASRILLDQFNGNLIISGAFGLYKKAIVIAVGGYKLDTIGEDMELVMRLHSFMLNNRHPYKIRYQSEAICWSQSPESLRDIINQRRRWHIGLFQSLSSYPEMPIRFRYKPVGFVSYGAFLFFDLFGPFIEIFGIATIILAAFFDLLNVPFMINLFIIYTGYGVLLSLTAFFQRVYTQRLKLHGLDVVRAVVMVIIENAFYRYLVSLIRVSAVLGYNKKRKNWGTIKRKKHKTDMYV